MKEEFCIVEFDADFTSLVLMIHPCLFLKTSLLNLSEILFLSLGSLEYFNEV